MRTRTASVWLIPGKSCDFFGCSGAHPTDRSAGVPLLEFDELRRRAKLLDGMASYNLLSIIVTIGDGRPVHVSGSAIYGDFFEVLGAVPAAGRLLTAAETEVSRRSPSSP